MWLLTPCAVAVAAALSSQYHALLHELHNATRNLSKEGYSAQIPEQSAAYWDAVTALRPRTICETGFNAGHSALLWLSAAPDARVVTFDLFSHASAPVGLALLRRHVGDRLVAYQGRSAITLPRAQRDGVRCDVFSIDGGHTYAMALADLVGVSFLVTPGATCFIDDTNCKARWCVDAAFKEAQTLLNLTVVRQWSWHHGARGLSQFRYDGTT